MKSLNQFIIENIVKNKLPKNKKELISNIKELIRKGVTDLNCIDTSKITDMSYLFTGELGKIDKINISNWDVSNVTNMKQMFAGYKNFNCDLSNWDVSKVKNMDFMFNGCKEFEGKGLENWNVSNVMDMVDMFNNCNNLKNKPRWYE